MRPLWYRLKNKDGKKRKLDGKLKVKFSIMIAQAMFLFFKVILPIVVLVSLSFIMNSWVEDVFQSKNNPEYLYQVLGKEDLNELISVAGDENNGYYLAYKEGFDEKLDDVVKRYKRIGYSYITKDILINMIKAELITQYPDLGGEIGHESDVKIGATYGGGVMNIPLIYQKRASTCGPTVLAMIISYLTNTEVTEDDVYNWCKDDSRYFNGIGSNKEIFAAAAEKWGVGPVTETKSVADVRQALLSGKPVVAYVHAGEKKEFTNGSHFIVLTGIDENGKVHVNSSSSGKPTVGKAYDLEADIDSVADSDCPYFIFEYGASVSTSSGTLYWPSDSTTITSKFGPRNSPTAGASSNHGGVDIGADYGTNVYACSSGKVTLAQDYGSAGNCVIIDHGDGYFSKYMHNSELKVSAGDQVQKGQVIALVGSTGVSTGPHLHFQIEKGGTPVDPMSFKYENGVGEGTDQSFGETSNTSLDGFLFLGDTITEGLKNSKVADDNVTFKTKKDEGSKYWLDNFDSLPEKNGIKGVNVLLGTSDYKDGIDNIKKLIEKLHEKYPDVTIYVDKLLSDSSSDVDSTKRDKYISDLKSYCEGKSYIKYIDPTSGVKIKSGECYPASEDDYKTLWNNIKKAILNTGNTSSEEYVPPLIVGNDTGEGVEGFQGAIRIRRVTPNKAMGAILNTGTGPSSSVQTVSGETAGSVKEYLDSNAKDGTWAVYAKNLKSGEEKVKINSDTQMQSASVIKLFIAATSYQKMSEGKTIDNAESLIQKMLSVSDNDATNELIRSLGKLESSENAAKDVIEKTGMKIINEYISNNGYSKTQINRLMLAPSTNGDNYTSVSDAAKILEKIYNKECVNKTSSEKMLNYLKAQERRKKIPAGVPSGVVTANKTGELSTVENDAAIVYKENAPYILVVMSSGLSDTDKAVQNIVGISKIVYEKIDSKDSDSEETEKDDTNKKDDTTNEDNKDKNKEKHVIAVVAGHGNSEGAKKGWYTTGTADTTGVTSPAWEEKDITLKVANYVKEICKEKYPHLTIVTDGYSKDNEERLKIAKNAGAEMFIGVHFNSSSDSSVQGTGVYYQKGTNYESETKKLAEKLQKTIMDKMGTKEAEGVKDGDYEVFKDGRQNDFGGPALYVEGAFMSNKNDMEIISKDNDEGLKNYAEGIVAGILEYYGEEEDESTYSDENVASSVNSKIYDLKYIPENEFNKKINQQDPSVLNYYTLDGNWKLVVASWSYSTDNGIKFTKNTAINYKSVLKKYITPIEYLMDYYINIKEEDFINDFMNLIYDSEFIIAVQDNVTTTETTTETTVTYDDGTSGGSSSDVKINETVKTGVEVTYVDTWFVKFAKQTSYSAASIKSSGGSLTGSAGDLVGEYKTTSYCYICNDDGSGNFGTNVTASGAPATPHRTVAIHNASTGGDPNGLKLGDQIMIEGDPTVYVIEDTGSGQDGAWIDVYVEATGSSRRDCCISSEYADRTVKVYYANGVKEASEDDSNVDDKHKLINTIANVSGKVSDSYSTSSSSEAGPIKTVYDKVNEAYINIGSTRTINITTHTISVQYDNGDAEVSSNEEKFLKLFEDNPKALNRIKGKWLITLISRNDRTSPFLDLTKYLLYKLLGKSYGVTEFDFSIYEPESFTSMKSSSGGREQFVRWLHEWEGINGSISADGKKYIIGDDGFGHPTVGYGIDIFNGGFAERFRAAGYSTDVGAEVDKEFVDNLEKEEIDKAIETVEAKCAGLNLTQYQKYALVSRIFNCGESGAFRERNGKDFVAAYTAYWNADTDDEYKVPANESMFSHKLYTTYMYAPNTSNGGYVEGLNKRRRAEWLLFKTGYYDRIDEYYEEGGDIVNVADEVHKYIEQNGYYYSLGDDLPGNINSVKNTKAVCCATFVSWTLYEAGYDWMEECTGINYCGTLLPFLESHGGQKIAYTSMSDLQPGDILFYGSGGTAHTDIYAGDGMWYNCGGNSSVKGSSPYAKGVRSDVYCIIRFN